MPCPRHLSALAIVALVLTACGASDVDTASPAHTAGPTIDSPTTALETTLPDTGAAGTTSPAPGESPQPERKPAVTTVALSSPISHVHGLVVDADGAVRAGTHDGVRVIGVDGEVQQVGPADDLMGMTGLPRSDVLFSSGHPGPGSPLPNPVGLIRSDDGGATWTPLSLQGQVDFHALGVSGDRVVGFDGFTGLLVSDDGGLSWTPGAAVTPMSLAVVGEQVWAATPQGLQVSDDGGATFEGRPGAPLLWLVAAGADGSLWGIDVDNRAWRSVDGETWDKHKRVPPVEAIAVSDESTAYALSATTLVLLTA